MKYIEKYLIYSPNSGSHIVSKVDDGSYACDCIGWTRHYPRINCKHIREVLENHPVPLDPQELTNLHLRKGKVRKALDLFRKTSATSISAEL